MNVTSQLGLHRTLQGEGLSPTHVSDCSDMGGSMAEPECYQLPDGTAIRSRAGTQLNTVSSPFSSQLDFLKSTDCLRNHKQHCFVASLIETWSFIKSNEVITRIKMKPYVLKHGSPDMSCVVMTTCKGKHKVNRVMQKHSWIGLDDDVRTK